MIFRYIKNTKKHNLFFLFSHSSIYTYSYMHVYIHSNVSFVRISLQDQVYIFFTVCQKTPTTSIYSYEARCIFYFNNSGMTSFLSDFNWKKYACTRLSLDHVYCLFQGTVQVQKTMVPCTRIIGWISECPCLVDRTKAGSTFTSVSTSLSESLETGIHSRISLPYFFA